MTHAKHDHETRDFEIDSFWFLQFCFKPIFQFNLIQQDFIGGETGKEW